MPAVSIYVIDKQLRKYWKFKLGRLYIVIVCQIGERWAMKWKQQSERIWRKPLPASWIMRRRQRQAGSYHVYHCRYVLQNADETWHNLFHYFHMFARNCAIRGLFSHIHLNWFVFMFINVWTKFSFWSSNLCFHFACDNKYQTPSLSLSFSKVSLPISAISVIWS